MPGLHFRKTLCPSNTKFPFKAVYFLEVRGLTTSSHTIQCITIELKNLPKFYRYYHKLNINYYQQISLWHLSTMCSPFSSWLIKSHFSKVPIVFCKFFTWSALGDAHWSFSFILVTNANAVVGETTLDAWLYHQHNQSIHARYHWRDSYVTFC
jgi:hypothetical protein